MTDGVLTLQEVADELGVHYMTAYRYVRLGVLDATKSGGVWQVDRSALERFRAGAAVSAAAEPAGRGGTGRTRARRAPWASRLESRLIAGDAPGSWSVVEAAMAAGAELDEIYLEVLTPAMVSIGERWAAGELDISIEHRATGIAMRIVGRIGPRFSRRGRSRGIVALGAPAGEFHALPIAMLGDLLRLRGWEVSDFGVDVPSESLAHVIRQTPDLMAVGLSAMSSDNLPSLADACAAAHRADPEVFVIVGGHAVTGEDHARSLGADAYAMSGSDMDVVLTAHAAG
ncbi:MAG TPA: cobalamin-dependent protein [Ilumatobacteraceae bacterium]|nr:cobalamin-dependent protein [Ilumatobacteraceae bacterium]